MSDTRTIYDMTISHLEEQLIGRRIVATDDSRGVLTLDDGTVLELEGAADCCAWFKGTLKTIDLAENAITAVRYDDRDDPTGDGNECYTLTVLSIDREVCAIEIDGDATSGYYCHSINLRVKK